MTTTDDYEDREQFDQLFADAIEVEGFGKAKVVAMITDGETFAYGYNSNKTHPFQKQFGTTEENIYLHAEIDAIKSWIRYGNAMGSAYRRQFDFIKQMEECDMYIMRVKRDGRGGPWITGLSKPCVGCMRAIATFGISRVYYTEDNAKEFSCL
jgi:tRNA(Arg) A34 adenosine deaminase TadA